MPDQPADLRDLLALHLTPGLGPHRIAALLERFGSAAGVLRAGGDELRQVPGIGDQLARQIVEALPGADVEAELSRAARAGVRLVALGRADYPAPVATIPGAPHLLYVRGTLTARDERAVALVGSRRCSEYGRRATARLATGLARAGVTVVSGLPHATTLNTFLTLPFDACVVDACKEEPPFAVTRSRGEGGKFQGPRSEELHPAAEGPKA